MLHVRAIARIRPCQNRRQLAQRAVCTLQSLGLKKGDQVTVGMSGGVDSSVALRLLADLVCTKLDLDLSAVFMRNWLPEQSEVVLDASSLEKRTPEACEWEKDYEDVKRVCQHVGGAAFKVDMVDLSNEYWLRVFEPAIEIWDHGGTPNPDVSCNSEIKFGALVDRLLSPKHFLATGHYAQVERAAGRTRLLRSMDPTKDQTYFLSSVSEHQLSRAVFPLAHYTKAEVRTLAVDYGLHTAERAESMGVCFIGERGRFGDFVGQYVSEDSKGSIVDSLGNIVSSHEGLWHFTIGQRARIAGRSDRWYVARKGVGPSQKDLLVVPGADHPALQCKQVRVPRDAFSWIWPDHPDQASLAMEGRKVFVQIRHRMRAVPGSVRVDAHGQTIVTFDDPVTAVSPGQVVAIWDGIWCLGSGTIRDTVCIDDM